MTSIVCEGAIVDEETGRQIFKLISTDAPWARDQFFVVPPSLNLDAGALAQFPHFPKNSWPDFSNPILRAELFRYFYFLSLNRGAS